MLTTFTEDLLELTVAEKGAGRGLFAIESIELCCCLCCTCTCE